MANDNLILVSGGSASGKSACLRNLPLPEGVAYMNCEAKKLPFKSKFLAGEDGKPGIVIEDPTEIYTMVEGAEEDDDIHTIIIDTMTRMMDLFETKYVKGSPNGLAAWSNYADFWKTLMSDYIGKSTKNVIILAHSSDVFGDEGAVVGHCVQVKGSLMKIGIESYFTTVVSAKKMSVKELKKYKNDLLTITDKEERLGFKYVLQTDLTKKTMSEKIRSGFEMWDEQETFIDNDIQHVIDRCHEYYDD